MPKLDLVSVRRSGARVLRVGDSPMVRGTAMLFDDKSGIVYLKGTVPYFHVYPGAYVPARRVGDILKHVPGGKKINARFRYFT
jgi:hypothetical protein